jgi:Tol biopolymer transport system component
MTAAAACAVLVAAAVGIALLTSASAPAQLSLPSSEPETRASHAQIAFAADGDIHAIAADGSARRRLTTSGSRAVDQDPAWSPDGSTVAFARLSPKDEREVIWFVNRDGGGLRALTPSAARGTEQSGPTWSADGSRIAFVRSDYDPKPDRMTNEVVSVRADGGDERVIHRETITGGRGVVFFTNPAWSPTGDRILFTRLELFGRDVPPELWVVPAAGGAARRLAANGDDGAWSAGGERIAYSVLHDRGSGRACARFCAGAGEIHAANADGTGRVRLTTSRAHDRAPSWSSDGLRIAFQSDRNSTQAEDEESPPELYSIGVDGSCLTWLTNGTAHSVTPDFERGTGLTSDPGGCGAVPREPLVETGMPKEQKRRFTSWWLGRVAPNGLLLTDVAGDPHSLSFGYHDCGRFDPNECGDFVNVGNADLCRTGGLRSAGRRGTTLSLARGALFQETIDPLDRIGRSVLFTHRTRVLMDTASGFAVDRAVIAGLRRFPATEADEAKLPSARLPANVWRELRSTRGASRREVRRRRAVARRLAQLGVKRGLSCSG